MHASTMRVKMCLRVLRASRAEDWILVGAAPRARGEGRALLREGLLFIQSTHPVRLTSILQFTRKGEGPSPRRPCAKERSKYTRAHRTGTGCWAVGGGELFDQNYKTIASPVYLCTVCYTLTGTAERDNTDSVPVRTE